MSHIFKCFFWCNYPTSFFCVDEVGHNHDGKISEVDVMNFVASREAMESLSISHPFNHGWACHQKKSKMYGGTLITRFKDNISKMFKHRERDNG